MKPLISIIIPAYNAELFLNRTMNSVVKQTYENLDILIVNDGSTDRTKQLSEEWAAYDSRVRVINQENGGVSKARNVGVAGAKGQYISFVDADDEIELYTIERLYNLIEEYDAQMAACRWKNVYHDTPIEDEAPGGSKVFSTKEAVASSLKGKELSCGITGKLFEKELFKDISFPLGMTIEDAYVIMEITLLCERVAYTGERLYIYHHRVGSIMHSDFSERDLNVIKAHKHNKEVIMPVFPDLELLVEQRLAWAYLYVYDKLIMSDYEDEELKKELKKEILLRKGVIMKDNYFNRGRKLAILVLSLSEGFYKKLVSHRMKRYIAKMVEG